MTEQFAEYAASALDSYQNLFEGNESRDHRTDDRFAGELIGDLLTDLMHLADRRGLNFDGILRAARDDFLHELPEPPTFTIGSAVRLKGPAAEEAATLGQPLNGAITGLVVTHQGTTEFYIRRLGDTRSQPFTEADLEPTTPFPAVPTSRGIVDHPLKAEAILVDAAVRTTLAATEHPFNAPDHQSLLTALASWNGLDERSTRELLLAKVAHKIDQAAGASKTGTEALNPARMAAQGFPSSLGSPAEALTSPAEATTAERRPGQRPASGSHRPSRP